MMTYNNFEKLNNTDLEVGLNTNKQNTLTNVELNNTSSSGDFATNCCIISFKWVFVMIFVFPLTFCDLYHGYNDNSCVSEPAGKLTINLKDYLLVYGWINLSSLIIFTIGLCFINLYSMSKINDTCFVCCEKSATIIFAIINIFSIIWNVFGAVIFWSLMYTSDCNDGIYNYVFASLVIKLCFNVIKLCFDANSSFQGKKDNK